jgi:hypothetical protein
VTSPTNDPVQYPLVSLKVDWGRDGNLNPYADLSRVASEVNVERSVTSDLPPEVGLVEGYASAQLTATLDTAFIDGTEPIELFAPYRTDSALYLTQLLTAPVVCDMGLASDTGPIMTRQFTGRVQSVQVDSANRTVKLTAVDYADSLRAAITLPQYGQLRSDVITHGYKFTINSQAIIDYVLRQNGIYASPPPVPTAQLSITGHGWLTAEIGRTAFPTGTCTPITADSWWVLGPFNMLAVRGIWDTRHAVTIDCFTQDQFNPRAGNGTGVAMWVYVGNNMTDIITNTTRTLVSLQPCIDGTLSFDLRIVNSAGTTSVAAAYYVLGDVAVATIPVTTTTGWTYVAAHYQIGTGGTTTVTCRVNTTTTTATVINQISIPYLRDQMYVIAHTNARSWSNLQVWYDYNPPSTWPGQTWTPQASIAAGYNQLTHLPDVVGADSWQVIRDVTTAELGLCQFDPSGVFTFTPRAGPPDPTTVEITVTDARALLDLTLNTSSDAVRNAITTDTTAAYLTPTSVVNSNDVATWDSPVGTTIYKVVLPYGTIGPVEILPVSPYTTATWDTPTTLPILEGFVAVQASAPNIELPSGSVYVHFSHSNDRFALQQVPPTSSATTTATPTGNRVGLLKIQNYSGFPVRFATTNGAPALRVAGWALVAEPTDSELVTNPGSVTLLGQRVFSIGSSPYRQLVAPLRPVVTQLLTQLANPLPVIDSMQVLGNPAVQLGGTAQITDTRGHGSFRGTIVSIKRDFTTTTGLLDTLVVRPINSPGLGITDDTTIGLADSTLIAGP